MSDKDKKPPTDSKKSGIDADAVRKLIYERFDMSLGTGLGKMKGRMFRIGHLGDCNDLMLLATLAGCEMGLRLAGGLFVFARGRCGGPFAAVRAFGAGAQGLVRLAGAQGQGAGQEGGAPRYRAG